MDKREEQIKKIYVKPVLSRDGHLKDITAGTISST